MTLTAARSNHTAMRLFVHLLVIMGLVLATVSPACAFIGGQAGGSMIQICGADGHVKTIAVPAEFDPAMLFEQAGDEGGALQTPGEQCPFCLNVSALKGQPVSSFTIVAAPQIDVFVPSGSGSIIRARTTVLGFSPTGPPVLFVM